MTDTVPGASVPDVGDQAERLFWRWRHYNPRLAEGVSQEAFADILRLGGRRTLRASEAFVELAPLLRDLLIGRDEREAVPSGQTTFDWRA